ncbi:MAG: 30S ribosomal protein S8 [Parcubacteria group bacterium CG1_02_37_51]|uniref:Small ribosomal subunit protein uS8 n=2 Tax=Candidatus Komeiliibacteriota TaxID=1817908 RepID=A0A2M8DRK0_9BACT|nr:MAG: 30S ribosomal protein S8 [Parcubacteria group bacterium CG1_02_37_51]PIY94817.1 MAG: 30S ribosomal protein S8 [Candidatus Komeilibacteria bacterium CG_4_10_14_0_8_um_filter_37_78]PJC01991.1 MAG: 30S ribosomal protein S8 [Candidatus Komeilibacteria bacterium CG_4_9_14_0_8_um_filter_36_9]
MTVTDPISDMLTRVRNALQTSKAEVVIPWSKIKYSITKILIKEGYLDDVEIAEKNGFKIIIAKLKYNKKQPAIQHLRRVSKLGRRTYVKRNAIPYVLNGMGISIISTSKGLKTDKQARRAGLGGELICEIW